MYAVIFEVSIREGQQESYLQEAARLREHLTEMPGFISIERFESLYTEGKLLSLSYWESEDAIAHWRNFEEHRTAQARGREQVFENYRISVAKVVRQYSDEDRAQAPR